jgi:hypothetical protein
MAYLLMLSVAQIVVLTGKKNAKLSLSKSWWPRGRGGTAPLIINLGIRWERVVNFMLWPVYSCRKKSRQPLNRRPGAPQGQSEENTDYAILAPVLTGTFSAS